MVSFTDHQNAICINRFPSKKDSWYFNNSFLCKPEFSLNRKTFLFLLKTQNTIPLQQVTGGKTLNIDLKKMLELFLKSQENIRISILKRRLENLYKKNFKPKINSMIENLQNELQKTNKQKVLNFVLTLDGGSRAKNASKLSSKYLIDIICKIKRYWNYIIS